MESDAHLRIKLKDPFASTSNRSKWASSTEPLHVLVKPRSGGGNTVTGQQHQQLSTSSPGAASSPSRTVPPTTGVASRHGTLPPHLHHTIALLGMNLAALQKFATELPMLTPTEVTTASIRVNALLKAQQCAVDDIATFTGQEVKFSRDRITELSAQMLANEKQAAQASIESYRAIYAALHATATVCAADNAYILVRDSPHIANMAPVVDTSPSAALFDTPHPGPPRNSPAEIGEPAKLRLIAQVSVTRLGAANTGGVPTKVLELCEAVVRTTSAVNITARSAPHNTPLDQRTILAVPIRLPGYDSTILGVVAFVGKGTTHLDRSPTSSIPALMGIAPPAVTLRPFTEVDECRCMVLAEQLGVLASSLPVGVSDSGNVAITPVGFQADWGRWLVSHPSDAAAGGNGSANGAIDYSVHFASELTSGQKRRFVLRSEHSGAALLKEMKGLTTRQAIDPSVLVTDLCDRLAMAESKAREAEAQRRDVAQQLREAEAALATVKDELRVSRQDANDMRVACERVLRMSYLDAAPQTGSESTRGVPNQDSVISALSQRVPSAPNRQLAAPGRSSASVPRSPRRPSQTSAIDA